MGWATLLPCPSPRHSLEKHRMTDPKEVSMRLLTAALLAAGLCPAPALTQAVPAGPPAATTASVPAAAGKRINRAIELLEQGQPVYYTTVRGGAGYDQGRIYAATQADYITYEMEHGALDFQALREFMRGLVEAGPT